MSEHVSEKEVREKIVEVHQKLYGLKFGVGNDGNTSFRINDDEVLITPRGKIKAQLNANDIVKVKLKDGKPFPGELDPSSELWMHLYTYQQNPRIQSLIHSHPPHAIACSLSGISLETPILPEVLVILGKVPTCLYQRPGTRDIASAVATLFKQCNAMILERHGVIAQGKTLDQAITRMETVEHTARILLLAHSCGRPTSLQPAEAESLLKLGESND